MHLLYLSTLLAAPLALAIPATKTLSERSLNQRVLYFQDNDPAGVSIVALRVSERDGTLSSPVRTLTGGKGLAGIAAIDQDSVTISGNYLFTPNAGDNTLSMFTINPSDPFHPKLLGKPQPTLGDTPVSVAYSEKLRTACVLNAGFHPGATCFSVHPHLGLQPLGGLRSVPQPIRDPQNTAVPAPGPLTVAADIVFNPSSSALFFTTAAVNAKAGHIYAYSVGRNGSVSMTPVVSEFPEIIGTFSLNFLDGPLGGGDERLVVTDPIVGAPGAAFLDVGKDLRITVSKEIALPREQFACWVAYAPQYQNLYVIDAGQPNFTYVDSKTGDVKGVVQYEAPPKTGGQDAVVLGDYLYFLTDDPKAPKIDVFELEGKGGRPRLVQSFDVFEMVGKLVSWQGLAGWEGRFQRGHGMGGQY